MLQGEVLKKIIDISVNSSRRRNSRKKRQEDGKAENVLKKNRVIYTG